MTPPITGFFEGEIKTEQQADSIVDALDEQERKRLLDALNKKKYEKLLNKPNMTAKDKVNIEKSIKFLVDKEMDTSENLKKLEAINYGSNFIEIAGLKFSREKLVPDVKFNDKPNIYGLFESNEKGIYKTITIYNGNPEYFLTIDQYIQQTEKQGKIGIEGDHMRKALQALPGEFSDSYRYAGANILGNILDLSMSGDVTYDGMLLNKDTFGSLSPVSRVHKKFARVYHFKEDKGGLIYDHEGNFARPCLFLLK